MPSSFGSRGPHPAPLSPPGCLRSASRTMVPTSATWASTTAPRERRWSWHRATSSSTSWVSAGPRAGIPVRSCVRSYVRRGCPGHQLPKGLFCWHGPLPPLPLRCDRSVFATEDFFSGPLLLQVQRPQPHEDRAAPHPWVLMDRALRRGSDRFEGSKRG